MQNEKCKMKNVKRRAHSEDEKKENAKCKMKNAKCKMGNLKRRAHRAWRMAQTT